MGMHPVFEGPFPCQDAAPQILELWLREAASREPLLLRGGENLLAHQIQKPSSIVSYELIQEVVDRHSLGYGEPAHFHLIIEMLSDSADATGCQPASQIVY